MKTAFTYLFLIIPFLSITQSSLYCDDISLEIDKFDKSKYYESPRRNVRVAKYITTSGTVAYLLCLRATSDFITEGKGVWIILDNGQLINKPDAEVKVKKIDGEDGYYNYGFIYMDQNSSDLEVFLNHSITDYKVYVHEVLNINGTKYKEYFKCLVSMK